MIHVQNQFYNASKGSIGQVIFGEIKSNSSTSEKLFGNRVSFTKLDGSMTISGFQLAEICALGNRSFEGTIFSDWIRMVEWNESENFVPEHFWRTLVADRGPGGIPPPTWYHRACQYCLEQSCGGDITLSQLTIGSCPSMAVQYLERVRSIIWNRKFLRTSDEPGEGYFGLAPSKAEKGDVVCIVYGCSVPVVLRRKKRIEGAWELIGECFVYGMMDGAAMTSEESKHPQEFEVR